jgi:hypothetical protein
MNQPDLARNVLQGEGTMRQIAENEKYQLRMARGVAMPSSAARSFGSVRRER